ncbi:transposase [Pectinatus frisingensis]|uniref:transposase n=1 Tax=Pectinatus frisingensis TaxID=865 RepID=UPI0018C84B39|nr:transposase [Pectinatus frisingensis]
MIKYSNEFKEETVKWVFSGVSASQVAREIGVNVNSFYTWKARYLKQPEQPFVGSGKLRDDDDELRKLHQQVKDLQQENDFLKKSQRFAKNLKRSDITTSKQTATNIQLRKWCAGPRFPKAVSTHGCGVSQACVIKQT